MARDFVDTDSGQFLSVENAPAISYPVTLAGWARNLNPSSDSCGVLTITDISSGFEGFALLAIPAVATFSVQAMSSSASADDWAASGTVAHVSDQWHHCAAIFASSTSRFAYVDGGQKIEQTDSNTPTLANFDTYTIGRRRNATHFAVLMQGGIAEVGLWDVSLSDEEIASLAAGMTPLMVRPQSLLGYWPLSGRYGRD